MNRTFQFFSILIGCTLFPLLPILAHDEPPKTLAEKGLKEKARSNVSQHHVKMQHAWVIAAERPGRAADSVLFSSNHYDLRGNPVEQVTIDSSGATRVINTFGEKNDWLEELTYFGDSLNDRTVFVYSPSGLIHQILSFENEGAVSGKLDYTYSDSTHEIITVKHDASGALQYTIVYTYAVEDGFKHNIASTQTKADGSLMVRVETVFDGDLRTSKRVYSPDGSLNRTFTYTYTSSGEYESISASDGSGTLLSVQKYQYAEDGLLAQVTTQNAQGEAVKRIHYHYEYFKDPLRNGGEQHP